MKRTIFFSGCLLVVIGLGIGGGIWWTRQKHDPSLEAVPGRSSLEIHTEWRQQAEQILSRYEQDQDAIKARDALLSLTVTQEDREAHLRLVLALEARRQGQPDADTRMKQAMDIFTKTSL